MKKIRIISIIVFAVILAAPMIRFNAQSDYFSEVDNSVIEDLPEPELSLDYVNRFYASVPERIGFRQGLINMYENMAYQYFQKLNHPLYELGEDGYIFFTMKEPRDETEFITAFADYVGKMQRFCDERQIPFLFVFTPEKKSIYSQYLPDGAAYSRENIELLFELLEERNVRALDLTAVLSEKAENEQVFNVKYDAGHWNDLGAFYGTNEILREIKKDFPAVNPHEKNDFFIDTQIAEYLPESKIAVNEEVPNYQLKNTRAYIDETEYYRDEIDLNETYKNFAYIVNNDAENKPRTLMFQGSYLNSRRRFLQSEFSEYISVHNYQNVLRFEEYYNQFSPDMVVFEVTEYTLSNTYFDYETMKAMELSPPLASFSDYSVKQGNSPEFYHSEGEEFTTFYMLNDHDFDYAYLEMNGREYTFKKDELDFTLKISNDELDSADRLEVSMVNTEERTVTAGVIERPDVSVAFYSD